MTDTAALLQRRDELESELDWYDILMDTGVDIGDAAEIARAERDSIDATLERIAAEVG